MKILLLGDYSNVHNTLAEGLKALGHECVVASDGDHWKDYPRDVDLKREFGLKGSVSFLWRLIKAFWSFRGYDIVQIINPIFVDLKAEKMLPLYRYLRRHNKKIVMGAFGMDYYWAQINTEIRPLRYSDFNIGDNVRMDAPAVSFRNDWVGTAKETLNKTIAKDCDWIVAGLYEYWETYRTPKSPLSPSALERSSRKNGESMSGDEYLFREKLRFIPFPIEIPKSKDCGDNFVEVRHFNGTERLKLFIGISKNRSAYKGTDIMLKAAKDVQAKYPDRVELKIAEGVPFALYQNMMDESDAILDQLYAYTPAMNSLLAMSKGIINIGGGEPENYEILGETELRPIINVEPTYESCFQEIEQLVLHPERIPELKRQSVEYVKKYHDYIKVAKQYEELYKWILQ